MDFNQWSSLTQHSISQVLEQPPLVIVAETTVANVIERIHQVEGGASMLGSMTYAIVIKDGEVNGVVTPQSILKLVADKKNLDRTPIIDAVVQPAVVLSHREIDMVGLMTIFKTHPIHHIPILDDQHQLIGVVTLARVLKTRGDQAEQLVTQQTTELTQSTVNLRKAVLLHHQIAEDLQESETKLASIVDIADDAIISIDEQHIIQLFNQGAERIFGYSSQEIIGQSLDILLPEAFRTMHRQHVKDFSEKQSISRRMAERSNQVFGLHRSGKKFPAEASISKIQTRTGYLFTVILKDISFQHHAQMALQRSEEQLRLITNALPVLISYVDKEQRYQFTNYAYEDWFGIPYQKFKNTHVKDLLGEVTYQTLKPHLEKALLGKSVSFEAEFPHQDGKMHWIRASYISDIEANRVKGCFGLITDISERKAADRLKDEFVSVVSHELRTPLTSIHGSLKLLATGQLGNLPHQSKALVDIALKNTERLTRLINDVLDLERIEAGYATLVKENCLSSDLVMQAVEAMQSMAITYDIVLSVEAVAVQLWVVPDQIEQTLTNLLSNAIKFSPPGSSVVLTAQDRDDYVLFKVKDKGRGIPESSLETIFERFKQVDASDSRKHGGTGLGLAICRKIVQQHGGRIWVTSTHGKGSTFCFTLPLLGLSS